MYVDTSSDICSMDGPATPARTFANSFLNSICIEDERSGFAGPAEIRRRAWIQSGNRRRSAERHVLHQAKDPDPVLGRNLRTSFRYFSIKGPIVSWRSSRSDGSVTINPPARSCARRPIS